MITFLVALVATLGSIAIGLALWLVHIAHARQAGLFRLWWRREVRTTDVSDIITAEVTNRRQWSDCG